MNDAHLHLLINHFPMVAVFLGVLVFSGGLFSRNNGMKQMARFILVLAAIGAFGAHVTGENAEELMESLPEISHKLIHEHEEATEPFYFIMLGVGLTALIGLFLNRSKSKIAKANTFLVLGLAVAACVASVPAGKTGGEIRHPEIRDGFEFPDHEHGHDHDHDDH